ncbi:MAG TPA: glycosyltransferase family 2 protein, partial [Bacteroidia bacterium]|nr:glycosyltransferase family 2 protein [Bacteroidia bacterium]
LIIPSYNRAGFIAKAIQSATQQTFSSIQIIVIDDGSTDNTNDVVASLNLPNLQYYKTENAERAAARNFGVSKATGQYITFLDSDDYLLPNHFEVAYRFIQAQNNPAIFYQPNNFVDANGKVTHPHKKIKDDVTRALIVEGNLMSCIGVFLRNEIAQTFKFNTDRALSGTEDHELWLRIAAHHTILYNRVVTSCMVQHDSRSVMAVNDATLIKRLQLFVYYMKQNQQFIARYKNLLPAMEAQAWSYLSLHFALTGKHKKQAIHFFTKAVRTYPPFIFQKRCAAIIKQLLLNN